VEVGYVDYLILLNAETTYQVALIQRIQAQATRFGDVVALFQALGGGWWNRVDVVPDPLSPEPQIVQAASDTLAVRKNGAQ